MNRFSQSDRSFTEIIEGKARRREELIKAIREADPVIFAEVTERLREAMRNKDPKQRRRRLGPLL
ncbi:conserved protein of unknown function [Pseudomonas mediterranea]